MFKKWVCDLIIVTFFDIQNVSFELLRTVYVEFPLGLHFEKINASSFIPRYQKLGNSQ